MGSVFFTLEMKRKGSVSFFTNIPCSSNCEERKREEEGETRRRRTDREETKDGEQRGESTGGAKVSRALSCPSRLADLCHKSPRPQSRAASPSHGERGRRDSLLHLDYRLEDRRDSETQDFYSQDCSPAGLSRSSDPEPLTAGFTSDLDSSHSAESERSEVRGQTERWETASIRAGPPSDEWVCFHREDKVCSFCSLAQIKPQRLKKSSPMATIDWLLGAGVAKRQAGYRRRSFRLNIKTHFWKSRDDLIRITPHSESRPELVKLAEGELFSST